MNRRFSGIALAAVATIAVASPAVAAVQILSFSGTLNNNSKNNATNPFGAVNSSLSGKSFSITLSYDPTQFANTGNCGSAPNAACIFTLSALKTISQSITVNGVTENYTLNSGTFNLTASGNDNFSFSINGNQSGNQVFTLQGQFQASNGNPNGFFPIQGAVNNPVFNNFTALSTPGATFTQNTTQFYAQASTNSITSLTASDAAVPEPATWAMMIAGFGAIGFALRRRRPAVAAIRFA